MPAQRVREQWRAVLDAARFQHTATVITYHQQPVAAVVPPGWWTPAPSEPAARELGVREARVEFGALLDAARDGRSVVIVRRGESAGVLVPYRWYCQARGDEGTEPARPASST
jgi:prevent-host-death family protein